MPEVLYLATHIPRPLAGLAPGASSMSRAYGWSQLKIPSTGKEIVVVFLMNSDAEGVVITIKSFADEMGRSGDMVMNTAGTYEQWESDLYIFGPLSQNGFRSPSDGRLHVEFSGTDTQLMNTAFQVFSL